MWLVLYIGIRWIFNHVKNRQIDDLSAQRAKKARAEAG
jgi:hypothetical protein